MGTGTVFELLGLLAFGVHVVAVVAVAVVADMAVVFIVDATVVTVVVVVLADEGAIVVDTCAVNELLASVVVFVVG